MDCKKFTQYHLSAKGMHTDRSKNPFRVPQYKAWEYSDVGYINSANAYAAVVIDIDRPEKLIKIIYAGSSFQPNWAVFNHKNGHAHAAYTLQKPVLKYSKASPEPLQYLADIEKKMIQALDGDPGYTAHLARNPITKGLFWNGDIVAKTRILVAG